MKLNTTFIALFTFAFCTQPVHKQNSKNDTIAAVRTIEHKDSSIIDKELEEVWTSFANAVLHNDTKLIAALSTDCIYCCDCVTNTNKEENSFDKFRESNPKTWYDKLYKDLCYTSTEKFIKDDLLIIFDTLTKSRLLNSSKLYFHNIEVNKELYDKACIIKSSELLTTKLMEVLVTTVDPSPKTEGFQKAFAFVLTKKGYRFSGFSTVP